MSVTTPGALRVTTNLPGGTGTPPWGLPPTTGLLSVQTTDLLPYSYSNIVISLHKTNIFCKSSFLSP